MYRVCGCSVNFPEFAVFSVTATECMLLSNKNNKGLKGRKTQELKTHTNIFFFFLQLPKDVLLHYLSEQN